MTPRRKCFVIMPFSPTLNFFYLYFRRHLEEKFPLEVERADNRVLTKPVMEKIRAQIQAADIIIGDITGRNANVFYELGLAEAWGKPAVLLTSDSIDEAPTDVRHLEFIRYDLGRETEFISKLDNAFHNLLSEPYIGLFDRALELLRQFNHASNTSYGATTLETFQSRVLQGERIQSVTDPDAELSSARFLLPKVLDNPTDWNVMERVSTWLAATQSN
jgi:hypothetical protein